MKNGTQRKTKMRRKHNARLRSIFGIGIALVLAGNGLLFYSMSTSPETPSQNEVGSSQKSFGSEQVSNVPSNATANHSNVDTGNQAVTQNAFSSIPQEDYVDNTIIVTLEEGQDLDAVITLANSLNGTTVTEIDASSTNCGYATLVYSGSAKAGQVADELRALGFTVQPDFKYYLPREAENAESILGDECDVSSSSINLQSQDVDDPASASQWELGAVHAYDAWDIAKCAPSTSQGSKVAVAVIDSGCTIAHEDLKSNIVGTYNTQTGGQEVPDEQNHGTPVAGIISAQANNGTGTAGVSYNASLYIVKALHNENGEYVARSTDIIKAYENIIDNRVIGQSGDEMIRVINMSLGSRRSGGLNANDSAVIAMIEKAYSSYDLLTVCAAGNEDGTLPYLCYPCDFTDTTLGVINLRRAGNSEYERNPNSNFNVAGSRAKQLSAPGTELYTTLSTGGYGTKSGTSMATPVVSGIAALVFAANPDLHASDVKKLLIAGADDIGPSGFDEPTGYGIVNALEAVRLAKNMEDKEPSEQPPSQQPDTDIMVYRLFNSTSGEHLFTTDENERSVRTGEGWIDEGVKWKAPAIGTPVYRLFNQRSGEHLYTADENERSVRTKEGWIDEGVKWRSDATRQIPVYRLFNPKSGEHLYTADENERSIRLGDGNWRGEGIAWYGL